MRWLRWGIPPGGEPGGRSWAATGRWRSWWPAWRTPPAGGDGCSCSRGRPGSASPGGPSTSRGTRPRAGSAACGGAAGWAGAPSASPDGSQHAYVGTGKEGSPQLFISGAGIDGTQIRQVTHDPAGADWPAWSPDGTTIAYVGGSSNPRDLFVLDVARGESMQIADGVADPYSGIQFAPDGSSVVYTDPDSAGGAEMRTVPVGGGPSTILFGGGHGGMGHAGSGSFSPDGSLVTMTGHEIGGPGAAVFVSNADGTQRRAIAGYGTNPAGTWSPDGSQIVCLSYKEDRILVVDIATGGATSVAKGREAIWLDDHILLVEA